MKKFLFAATIVAACVVSQAASANGYYGFYDQVGPFTGVYGWGDVRPRPYLRTRWVVASDDYVIVKRRHKVRALRPYR